MSKTKIKVIKRGEVSKKQPPTSKLKKAGPDAARQMVTTVSSWVNDFQGRKRTETKVAFESLFANRPQNVSS